jgi:hypothetical protein
LKEDCDLSAGFESYIQRDRMGPEPLHSLLDALIHLKKTGKESMIKADIVSLRSFFFNIVNFKTKVLSYN